MKTKKISIFGSTGSIGKNAISLLNLSEFSNYKVESLVCGGTKIEEFEKQVNALKPRLSGCFKEGCGYKFSGRKGITDLISQDESDVVVYGVSGIFGLEQVLELCKTGKKICLANKESIVCGWHLIKSEAQKYGTQIIPVDSEHNSLQTLLSSKNRNEITDVFITGSGGSFFETKKKFTDLSNIKYADISHPTWQMGSKITVDSTTMANKGLELIEACYLFDLEESQIKTYIHPKSIVHAGANLNDGSSIFFCSKPDMKLHIASAILGANITKNITKPLNLAQIKDLSFFEISKEMYPIFFIARQIAKQKDKKQAILFNILNDCAVQKFIAGKISFQDILSTIQNGLEQEHPNLEINSCNSIINYYERILR